MYEPILVISNGHDRRLAAAAVPVHCFAGEAGFADAVQLTLEGLGHICCIAEGQLIASQQEGVNHCQQSFLRLRDESGACKTSQTTLLTLCAAKGQSCIIFFPSLYVHFPM